MHSHCRECLMLVESALISEPHHSLKPILSRKEVKLYQCQDCESCFIFTRKDIALLQLSETELRELQAVS